jgi:hypothetical protein
MRNAAFTWKLLLAGLTTTGDDNLRIDAIVVDEAHEIGELRRGQTLERAIADTLGRFPRARLFFSSPLRSNPEMLLRLFGREAEGESFVEHLSPVTQNIINVHKVDRRVRAARMELVIGNEAVPLGDDPESASIPDEDLQAIALGVAEHEQVPAKRLTRQSIPDQTVQPFEPLAHVGDSGGQVDPCGWTQSKHGLHLLQCTHQALERIRIKIRMYLDPAPPESTTASPQLASCCVGDFLTANSTGTNRSTEEVGLRLLFQRHFFRWRSRVLKLKPRLWQNSLRRIPLLTNSATNC